MIEYKDTYPDPRLKSAAENKEEEAECDPDYVIIPRSEYTQLCHAEFCRLKLIRAAQVLTSSFEYDRFVRILLDSEVPPDA